MMIQRPSDLLCDATSSLVKVFAMVKLENEARLGGTELSKTEIEEGEGEIRVIKRVASPN